VKVRIGTPLSFHDVAAVAAGDASVEVAPGVRERMAPARRVVEAAAASGHPVYGINTGLGDLANVRIDPSEGTPLQQAILRSHATAVGPPLAAEVVRAMLLLKARTLAMGVSGVRFALVERLAAMLNQSLHPVVPSQGSLGASGDLAPLAHLALPLIGEGAVEVEGRATPAGYALRTAGLEPLELAPKEGLALVNGTEGMLALGILAWCRTERLCRTADVTAALSLEACLGTDRAFDPELVGLRRHPGAVAVARNLVKVLEDSPIVASHRDSDHLVQDAYSLRCIPQVHGAYRDALDYVRTTLERELHSAIDNPSVMVATDQVLSAGNFHGEALGLALDHLGIAVAGFATIAERRIARLVDPHLNNGLPAFLSTDPGKRSGFMIPQYTAAALVNENRSLCWPASCDSIPTSAGQEDHVSMGATSARKASAMVTNVENVIAIEALAAAQGLDMRAPLEPARGTAAARKVVRSVSSFLDDDRSLSDDISDVRTTIVDGRFLSSVAEAIGSLD
jgi:histidine ammonia-lyase